MESENSSPAIRNFDRSIRRLKIYFFIHFLIYSIASAAFCASLFFLYQMAAENSNFGWFTPLASSTLPSIAFGAGFLPQIRLNFVRRSSEGLSLSTILIDLAACVASIISVAINEFDFLAILPFLVIFGFQVFMLLIIFVIFPRKSSILVSGQTEEELKNQINNQNENSIEKIENGEINNENMINKSLKHEEEKELINFEEKNNFTSIRDLEGGEILDESELNNEKSEIVRSLPPANILVHSTSLPIMQNYHSNSSHSILNHLNNNSQRLYDYSNSAHESNSNNSKVDQINRRSSVETKFIYPGVGMKNSTSESSLVNSDSGIEDSPPSRISHSCIISTSHRSQSDSDDDSPRISRRSSISFSFSRPGSCYNTLRGNSNSIFFKCPKGLLQPALDYLTTEELKQFNGAVSKQLTLKLNMIFHNIN